MSFGKNLQYFRKLSGNMTQEALAEKLNVSRQTISKWEIDAANPEMEKALEICKVFNCSLDNLFRDEMDKQSDSYSNLRLEEVPGFRYVEHTVISTEPESDAIDRMYRLAKENGIEANYPKEVIKEAFQKRTIQNGQIWIDMLDTRNLTSHEYNMDKVDIMIEKTAYAYYDELLSFTELIKRF